MTTSNDITQYPYSVPDLDQITPEQARNLIALMRQATEQVPSHFDRYHDTPGLWDREMARAENVDNCQHTARKDTIVGAIRDEQLVDVPYSALKSDERRAAYWNVFLPNY